MPVPAPYSNPTSSISAVVTNQGRELIAKSTLGVVSFQLVGFKVGRDGYDYTTPDPLSTIPVNPASTDLIDPVFPLTGYAPFVTIENPIPNVVAPVCRLNANEANYGLGELGIWANVLVGDIAYPINTKVMFAVAHFPLLAKNDRSNFVFRVIIAV